MTSTLPDILFCGDPHGKFDHITRAAISRRPEAVVLLGDLDAPDYLSKVLAPVLSICTVLWIIGNHDTDSEELYLRLVEDPGHANLHCIDDKIVEVGGLRIAGLGGVFRQKIWYPAAGSPNGEGIQTERYLATMGKGNRWREGLPLKHRSTIFPDRYASMAAKRADILVTHEAPTPHAYGFEVLEKLATSMGARWSFHGHQHCSVAYPVQPGAVRQFGVGERAIMTLSGQLLA
jgi:predicted phosphodiesterase